MPVCSSRELRALAQSCLTRAAQALADTQKNIAYRACDLVVRDGIDIPNALRRQLIGLSKGDAA
jgi:hypothetical protein